MAEAKGQAVEAQEFSVKYGSAETETRVLHDGDWRRVYGHIWYGVKEGQSGGKIWAGPGKLFTAKPSLQDRDRGRWRTLKHKPTFTVFIDKDDGALKVTIKNPGQKQYVASLWFRIEPVGELG